MIITFPDTLPASAMSWGMQRRDMSFGSSFGSQSIEAATPLWKVSLSAPKIKEAESGAWQALLLSLKGRTNQLELWHILRPAPIGTMRGTMTLGAAAAKGATSLTIAAGAGQASTTLKQGDLLGLGSILTQQVVMVTADATADGSGNIIVSTEPALRNDFAVGAAVTWDKPKALFRQASVKSEWNYVPGVIVSGFSLDLIEDWRP
jgi:hypothetical protein